MMRDVPEPDWKVFRELREVALERSCKRLVEQLHPVLGDSSRSYHARYREVSRLVEATSDQLADAFDNPRRSDMVRQLLMIVGLRLLEPSELQRFSEATRMLVESWSRERR